VEEPYQHPGSGFCLAGAIIMQAFAQRLTIAASNVRVNCYISKKGINFPIAMNVSGGRYLDQAHIVGMILLKYYNVLQMALFHEMEFSSGKHNDWSALAGHNDMEHQQICVEP